MNDDAEHTSPRILYSCHAVASREGEQFIHEHVLSYIIAGTQEMHIDSKTYGYKAGDFRLFRKNQLCRFIKHPPQQGEFRSISVRMDRDSLQAIATEFGLSPSGPYTGEPALTLKPDELLRGYIESLQPYLSGVDGMNDILTAIKVKEAVMILLSKESLLKNLLFDFAQPGKIDLEAFMNKNFRYNVQLSRFAFLTGRSLASFKRDFQMVFHKAPNRWLLQKRLDEARYLIRDKGLKSSDVYLDVGFKDFSHFSVAFKKAFGVSPSKI